jgi:ABC-type molybdate transport system substrate-binding protein
LKILQSIKNEKIKAMKKLLVIVTVISVLAACNNKTEESSSAGSKKDTVAADSPLVDAVNTADSAAQKMHDSTGKMVDTMIKK